MLTIRFVMSPQPSIKGAKDVSERTLLDRIARGDAAALKFLYERCSGRAFGIALRVLRSRAEAEEVLQETFLHVWRHARDYHPWRGDPEAWIVTIARSRAIDRTRRMRTAVAAQDEGAQVPTSAVAPGPAPLEVAVQRQERERVQSALNVLPEEQRQVVELAYFEGLTQQQIAERTGDPLGTVKTRVRLALRRLAAALGGEGVGEP